MLRVIVYIDGFNLYHGMHAKFGRQFLWLDLERLGRELLRPGQRLVGVRYFTARVRRTDAGRLRQLDYLEALRAHCSRLTIMEGKFQEKTITCFTCRTSWITFEEKESDVSLAVSLVEDAALDHFDVALVISADSDLCPAVRVVRRIRPKKKIIAVFPPKRHSDELRRHVDRVLRIDRAMLNRAQLPAEIVTPAGIKLSRPGHWS